MANYYIDFVGGSDAANGTSTGTPWKHCPGDANATGVPAALTPQPGDKFFFKGDVSYRGVIPLDCDGVEGNPIEYIGNEWGGVAILDGSKVIASPTWTPCVDAADCNGNPNWAEVYHTPIPSGMTDCLPQMIMDKEVFIGFAQAPQPSDNIFFERIDTEWYVTPPGDVTQTELVNTTVFVNPDPDYYADCFLGLWVQGNSVETLPILSYDPVAHSVTYDASHAPYDDRDGYFSIFGNPADIYEGSYAINTSQNRLYLWPPGSVDPNAHEFAFGFLRGGFGIRDHAYIVIRGFKGMGFFQGLNEAGELGYFAYVSGSGSGTCDGCQVNENELLFLRSLAATPAIHLGQGADQVIANNIIHDNTYGRGIATLDCDNMTISGNVCYRFNGTGIFASSNRDSLIELNTVRDILGIHGNAISPYTGCENVRVTRNKIKNVNTLITYETSTDLQVDNNEVNCNNQDQRCLDNGGMMGYVRWWNNTIANNPNGTSWIIGSSPLATYSVKNNGISGGGKVGNNNIYTALASYQQPKTPPPPYPNTEGWNPGPGDIMDGSNAEMYVSTDDLHLKPGSIGIGAGEDMSAFYTTDVDGNPRTVPYDVGAYAYSTTPPTPGVRIITSQGFTLATQSNEPILTNT